MNRYLNYNELSVSLYNDFSNLSDNHQINIFSNFSNLNNNHNHQKRKSGAYHDEEEKLVEDLITSGLSWQDFLIAVNELSSCHLHEVYTKCEVRRHLIFDETEYLKIKKSSVVNFIRYLPCFMRLENKNFLFDILNNELKLEIINKQQRLTLLFLENGLTQFEFKDGDDVLFRNCTISTSSLVSKSHKMENLLAIFDK